jgi:hypothetical protein
MPEMVVTVPDVPRKCAGLSPMRSRKQYCASKLFKTVITSSTIPSYPSTVTSRPPCRSARLTTPTGSDVHAAMQFCTPTRW